MFVMTVILFLLGMELGHAWFSSKGTSGGSPPVTAPFGRPPSDGTPPLRGSVCQRANGGVDRSYLERPVNCESAQEEARCDESNNNSASNEGGSSSEETIPVGNSNDGPPLRISGIEVDAHDVGNDRDHRGR